MQEKGKENRISGRDGEKGVLALRPMGGPGSRGGAGPLAMGEAGLRPGP